VAARNNRKSRGSPDILFLIRLIIIQILRDGDAKTAALITRCRFTDVILLKRLA
jgi:hypothetical protein